MWCPWPGLNGRPLPYQGSALPLSYMGKHPRRLGSSRHEAEGFLQMRMPNRPSCARPSPNQAGAGEGNRTLVISLEGFCSTIELHPRRNANDRKLLRYCIDPPIPKPPSDPRSSLVEGEGFEPSKAEPADLQSAPFDRSGTPPNETRNYRESTLWCQTILCPLGMGLAGLEPATKGL